MRTNYKIAVWRVLILCALYTFAQGQSLTPSIDPDREVIVMFKSDAVIPPANRTEGRPDEFQIQEEALRHILLNANVGAISRLMPDFLPEQKYAVSRTGEEVQLTDWTHVYVLHLPQPQAREGFLNALKKRPEVIFAELHGRGEPDLIPNDQYFNRQWTLKNDGPSRATELPVPISKPRRHGISQPVLARLRSGLWMAECKRTIRILQEELQVIRGTTAVMAPELLELPVHRGIILLA